MMSRRNTPLQVATKGVLAGMGGALILTGVVSLARAMSSSRERRPADGTGITAGEALSEDPGLPPQISQVTALFVQKVATGIFGTSLNREQQYVAGVGWHLAYGGFWGAGYGLVRGSVRTSTLALIPVHGLLVWAIGPGWLVPRMNLMLSPFEHKPRTVALILAAHLAYSTATALCFDCLLGSD